MYFIVTVATEFCANVIKPAG